MKLSLVLSLISLISLFWQANSAYNCKKEDPNDPNICLECEIGFYVKNGYCIYCSSSYQSPGCIECTSDV